MVPLNESQFVADLIKAMGAKVILVSRNYLGSINHSLLTARVCRWRSSNPSSATSTESPGAGRDCGAADAGGCVGGTAHAARASTITTPRTVDVNCNVMVKCDSLAAAADDAEGRRS